MRNRDKALLSASVFMFALALVAFTPAAEAQCGYQCNGTFQGGGLCFRCEPFTGGGDGGCEQYSPCNCYEYECRNSLSQQSLIEEAWEPVDLSEVESIGTSRLDGESRDRREETVGLCTDEGLMTKQAV